jgi:hypothetical protein
VMLRLSPKMIRNPENASYEPVGVPTPMHSTADGYARTTGVPLVIPPVFSLSRRWQRVHTQPGRL